MRGDKMQRGEVCRLVCLFFAGRGARVVSRDVCNESDASLDVLSAQGARL